MSNDSSSKVAVVGAGTMGSGIAQIAATRGHSVCLVDMNRDQLDNAQTGLTHILERLEKKGKIPQDHGKEILKRINFSGDLEEIEGSEVVIEAIVEDLAAKQQLFGSLEKIVSDKAILATNTSSLSVTSIAQACRESGRALGMHFFNPAPVMSLVEIVPGLDTVEETINRAVSIARAWQKTPVIAKDTPGFIVNRVARSFYGEALRMVDEGFAAPPEVDEAMRTVGGFKMGPFELMDLIGNDVNLKVTESVFNAFYQDPRYKPSFTQKRLVEGGRLGRKSGRGYYRYQDSKKESANVSLSQEKSAAIVNRIVTMIMNEAIDAVFWNVASPEDVDLAMREGVNYPRGPIEWAHSLGLDVVLQRMRRLRFRYSEDRYRPSPLLVQLVETGDSLL